MIETNMHGSTQVRAEELNAELEREEQTCTAEAGGDF